MHTIIILIRNDNIGNKMFIIHKCPYLILTHIPRPVGNASTLHLSNNPHRQLSRNTNGVNPFTKSTNSLPLANPTIFRAHNCNHPIKVCACTGIHIFPIVSHPEKFVTVFTSFNVELVKGLDKGADETCPQVP
jgi:hypothetical protein